MSSVAIQCVSRYLGQRATQQCQCPVQRLGRRSRFVIKFAIFSRICMCRSGGHVNYAMLCSLFHHVLSHFPFSSWLPRRPAYSLYVSFAITPVADGVGERTVSVMMSKRPASIADFLASPVRLTVSLALSTCSGRCLSRKRCFWRGQCLLLDCDEQCVLPVEYGMSCGLLFVRAFCTALC